MSTSLTTARYTPVAIGLHWLIAVVILATFALGLYMSGLPLSPTRLKLLSYHKWAGVTIFLLMVLRLLWRMTHRPPALPPDTSRIQQILAHGVHHLLYLLIFLIPITGWLMSSAKGFQTVWFSVLPLPDLLDRNKEVGDALLAAHRVLNYVMIVLVVGHALAALHHQFIIKDNLLRRMLWRKSK